MLRAHNKHHTINTQTPQTHTQPHHLPTHSCAKAFKDSNPFDWMELISLPGKANFFERRVGDYTKAGPQQGLEGRLHDFQLDADF